MYENYKPYRNFTIDQTRVKRGPRIAPEICADERDLIEKPSEWAVRVLSYAIWLFTTEMAGK